MPAQKSDLKGIGMTIASVWFAVKASLASIWTWIIAYRGWISASSIAAISGGVWQMLNLFKKRKLLRYARILRAFAQRMRILSPSHVDSFPIKLLGDQLGKERKILDDLMEFMEEEGWAKKVDYPPGNWKIV